MAYLYKNYCYSDPGQVVDAIVSGVDFAGIQVLSASHDVDQDFTITVPETTITYTAPDCDFPDNQFPPLIPADLNFIALLFVQAVVLLGTAYAIRTVRRVFR